MLLCVFLIGSFTLLCSSKITRFIAYRLFCVVGSASCNEYEFALIHNSYFIEQFCFVDDLAFVSQVECVHCDRRVSASGSPAGKLCVLPGEDLLFLFLVRLSLAICRGKKHT